MINKSQLRENALKKRLSFPKSSVSFKSSLFTKMFLESDLFKNNQNLYLYYPIKNELDTLEIIKAALKNHKRVFLPKLLANEMIFSELKSIDELIVGKYQIKEAKSTLEANEPGLMIIPLISNYQNYRLGYGQGNYDAYLKKHQVVTLGVGYQELESHDDFHQKNDIELNQIWLF